MMKKMNSTTLSVVALVLAFVLAAVVLWASKMKFVLKNPEATKKEVSWDKLLGYSGIFAIIIAIVVLIVFEGVDRVKGGAMSYRYCGVSNY